MLLLPGLGAVVLAFSACDEMMEPRPGPQPSASGSFTPERERVVGFHALFHPEAEKGKARSKAAPIPIIRI